MKKIIALTLLVGALSASPVLAPQLSQAQAQTSGPTTRFSVGGLVSNTLVLTADRLKAYPPSTINVQYFAGGAPTSHTFKGALLWDILQAAGIVTDPSVSNGVLRRVVVVIGSDNYQAVFGAGELSPRFGGNQVIIAYEQDGQPLGDDGFAKLVSPVDIAGGRFVSNISSIIVRDSSR
ncbi:molybdopterin-dependent oxidoreductase [Methylocella sp.]|uniref:molybdopterin-dependent oxidoreductase n=1 Tax=Methylocella sp. TaxID=1978226 RepID=UPI0035AF1B1F